MNKYYGLRLVKTFFLAASVVISISVIATVGGLGGLSVIRGETFDGTQALIALISGLLLALLCYAFGQLIDLQLKNYEVSWKLMEQIREANKLNNKTVDLLKKQLRILHVTNNIDEEVDVEVIEKQLKQRRENLF